MAEDYILLFVRQYTEQDKKISSQVIEKLKTLKIKHKIIDISEKFRLYGNEMNLEGPFALDFSGIAGVKIPLTPLAVAGDKVFNGPDVILQNLKYLSENYAET